MIVVIGLCDRNWYTNFFPPNWSFEAARLEKVRLENEKAEMLRAQEAARLESERQEALRRASANAAPTLKKHY